MKTTSITVERNFHIMNDDRFIMEKISVTAEVDEQEGVYYAIDTARKIIETNFKAAYPKVYVHLNFEPEPIQINPEYAHHLSNITGYSSPTPTEIVSNSLKVNYPSAPPEKIKQIPIEDQIQACKTVGQLNSFALIAGMNTKLQEQYHRKLKELEIKL